LHLCQHPGYLVYRQHTGNVPLLGRAVDVAESR
jgi:hypothetical protein